MIQGTELVFSLFNNMAIFIALVTLYNYLLNRFSNLLQLQQQALIGICFGVFAIGCMHAKIPVAEGVLVDQRNAVIALSGVFGGPVAAIISSAAAGCFRIYLGGAGVLGGVVGVSLAAVAGIILNRFSDCFTSVPKAAASSFFAVIVILPGFLLYKDLQTGWELLKAMALPYGIAVFAAIFLAGLLLNREKDKHSLEKELQQKEESLKITQFCFDKAAIGIYRVSSEGDILHVNEKAAESMGYTIEELTSLTVFDIDPRLSKEGRVKLWENIEAYGTNTFETNHRREDGSLMPVEITSNLQEYDGQRFAVSFVQDITKRKQVQKELDSLHRYLENIIDSMPSVIVGVDEAYHITLWNKIAENLTKISAGNATGRQLSDVYPRFSTMLDNIRQSMETGRPYRVEKLQREDEHHEIHYEDITIFPLSNIKIKGAVIRIDDVTEKTRMEEMLIQNEKMLSVGGLAAGMAHEINNPLAGVIQNINVMFNRLTDSDMPANIKAAQDAGITMEAIGQFMEKRDIPRMIKSVRDSGLRMSSIVENMLSFSRKSDSSFSTHHPADLMDKILELAETDYDLKKHYDFKSIKIKKEYENDLPMIACMGSKIQQVLLNILNNGTFAMFERGEEDDAPDPQFILRLSYKKQMDMVQIEIEDNGIGMDKSTRKKIFEPFFTTKSIGVGTGLGLSVSYFIITKDHNGTMEVVSKPGKGTTFIIRLPVTRAKDNQKHSA